MNIHESNDESKLSGANGGIFGGIFGFLAKRDVFVSIIIVFVGITSFFLGKLSVEREREVVNIQYDEKATRGEVMGESISISNNQFVSENEPVVKETVQAVTGMYVGSKNSNKFHLPWCAGAKQISDENKIWFQSKEEAMAKGYLPAANCKGI